MVLLTIGSWWSALSGPHQVFWSIAIVFSVLFLIQFVFGLIGIEMDADTDINLSTDIELDGDADYSLDEGFSIFSTRTIIAFFTFFGWTGILVLNAGGSTFAAVIAATTSGFLAMLLVAYMMWQFSKLTEEGNIDINKALHHTGEVYLRIPAKNTGHGIIHIKVQGSLREIDAITDAAEAIPTGSLIRVVEVLKDNILVVEAIEK